MTGWQWHQLDHMQIICTSLQTDNHASTPPLSFFTGRMPFLPPNQQRQSTAGKINIKLNQGLVALYIVQPRNVKGPFLQPRGIHTPHIRPQWKPNPGDAYENPPSHGHSLFRCCRVQSINVQPTLHGILFLVITMSIIQHQFSQDVAFFYEKSIFNGLRSDSMAVSHI